MATPFFAIRFENPINPIQEDVAEVLAKLANRSLSDAEIAALLAGLEGKELQVEMQFQRANATFAANAPDACRGGQTLSGKVGQQEAQVLIPEEDEKAARALSYGASLFLDVRYLEFDDFYRKVTFTGSLKPEPAKPEPVDENEPSSYEEVTQENEEPQEASTTFAPSATPPAKPKTGELAVFANPRLPESSGEAIRQNFSVSSAEIIADLARQTQSTKEEAAWPPWWWMVSGTTSSRLRGTAGNMPGDTPW
ncbi:MAG: hypothetical protein VCA36_06030 [Opitutales bacterium]